LDLRKAILNEISKGPFGYVLEAHLSEPRHRLVQGEKAPILSLHPEKDLVPERHKDHSRFLR
jgi:hypothetical protein